MIHDVVLTARLAGIPSRERIVMMVAPMSETMSAARIGRSVMPSLMVSSVRRAMVKPPRPIAAMANRIPWLAVIDPLPMSGATAFAALDAPALNPI